MRVRCYDVRVCINWNIAIVVDPRHNCTEDEEFKQADDLFSENVVERVKKRHDVLKTLSAVLLRRGHVPGTWQNSNQTVVCN